MRRSDDRSHLGQRLIVLLLGALSLACGPEALPPPPEPNGRLAFEHLEAQVAFGPRTPGSAAAHACREYALERFARCTPHTGLQTFSLADPYSADTLQLVNVLAHFHPERAARVLLAAHYDSRPWADRDTGTARELPVPGANDGASGVAVLLEIARVLQDWDPEIGVDIVLFDGEDYGREGDLEHYLLGARHFVATMGAYWPRAMLLLDMVGDRDLRIPMELNSLRLAPGLTRLVQSVADSLGVEAFQAVPGFQVTDDHVPFLRRGIAAVDLIDLEYPAWHTQRDLPDQCSAQSLESVARVVLGVLWRLGNRHRG